MTRGRNVVPEIVPERHSSAALKVLAVGAFMLVGVFCFFLAGPAEDGAPVPVPSSSVAP